MATMSVSGVVSGMDWDSTLSRHAGRYFAVLKTGIKPEIFVFMAEVLHIRLPISRKTDFRCNMFFHPHTHSLFIGRKNTLT